MQKNQKGVILTRQAKSSCKQACGCISTAVRAEASSLLIQQRNSLPDRYRFEQALLPKKRPPEAILSFLSPCHGGAFLENALCFLSFLSPCHGGVFLKNAPHSMRFQAAG